MLSVKPHLTPEEYAQTEATVQEFGSGVGLILQKKLLDKAEHSRNWVTIFIHGSYTHESVVGENPRICLESLGILFTGLEKSFIVDSHIQV